MSILNSIKSLSFFTKRKFVKKAYQIAAEEKSQISKDDIIVLWNTIKDRHEFSNIIRNADKSNNSLSPDEADQIFEIREEQLDYIRVIKAFIKAKKAKVEISLEKIIELYDNNANIEDIVKRLISKQKKGDSTSVEELMYDFFENMEDEKILRTFIKTQKDEDLLKPDQLIKAFYSNINIEKFVDVIKILKKQNLQIPDDIIFETLDDNINIIKLIKILSAAKIESLKELNKLNFFTEKEINTLANTYIIQGKFEFKTGLNNMLIKKGILQDPSQLYLKLIKSTEKGFKVNYEMLKPYLSFDFKPQIGKVINTYLNARTRGLYITLEQMAELAEENVDIENFIDAQIKSNSNKIS